MSTRIPSSLKWLIVTRARLDAEVQKTESSLAKAENLIAELSSLKEKLAAIDQALGLHEIKVDINLIQPIQSRYVRINLPHGELTRSILLCLRLHKDDRPLRMSEIVTFIASRHADLSVEQGKRVKLNRSVHDRLKLMAREGVVQRHHPLNTSYEGLWSLAPDGDDE
ncbi:MAG: hypothetical protein HZB95_12150 [Nitrosomonadales bacterium]|nr:hypothetical protein [Nitrosomonadales bacterium]